MKNEKPVVDENRKTIEVCAEIDWSQGTPDDIIKKMQELKEHYTKLGWKNLHIDYNWYHHEDCEYEITGIRQETDEEMQSRIETERWLLREWKKEYDRKEKARLKAEEKEREAELKELARLQAKYGNS